MGKFVKLICKSGHGCRTSDGRKTNSDSKACKFPCKNVLDYFYFENYDPTFQNVNEPWGRGEGDRMASRKWIRGRYLAAMGVSVGRKILSDMRSAREQRPSSSAVGDDYYFGGERKAL